MKPYDFFVLFVMAAIIGCYDAAIIQTTTTTTSETPPTLPPLPTMVPSKSPKKAFENPSSSNFDFPQIDDRNRQLFEKSLNRIFDNFTAFLQDHDPSVSVPIKEITTCIEENGPTEALKNFLLQAYDEFHKPINRERRINFCSNTRPPLGIVFKCAMNDHSLKNHTFFSREFYDAFMFGALQFCHSPDNFAELMNLLDAGNIKDSLPKEFHQSLIDLDNFYRNGKKQQTISESELCLPRKIAESFEVAAIQTRKFPSGIHGSIVQLFHVVFTIALKIPFKLCF